MRLGSFSSPRARAAISGVLFSATAVRFPGTGGLLVGPGGGGAFGSVSVMPGEGSGARNQPGPAGPSWPRQRAPARRNVQIRNPVVFMSLVVGSVRVLDVSLGV